MKGKYLRNLAIRNERKIHEFLSSPPQAGTSDSVRRPPLAEVVNKIAMKRRPSGKSLEINYVRSIPEISFARVSLNTGDDVIGKTSAIKEPNSDINGNNNIDSSDIVHKYEFGERDKDKNNK